MRLWQFPVYLLTYRDKPLVQKRLIHLERANDERPRMVFQFFYNCVDQFIRHLFADTFQRRVWAKGA